MSPRGKKAPKATEPVAAPAPDPYRLIEQLYRGGLGPVWKASDQAGRIVMVKLLDSAHAADPEYVNRFVRAFERARRIQSRNVVQVLNRGVRDGTPYAVLEYTDGTTLREWMNGRGPLDWKQARGRLVEVAQGLSEVHGVGLNRIDLRPSTILLGSDGRAKIADFQALPVRDPGTNAALYTAPEGSVDERSDLYSLGVLAYELLTGAPPAPGTTSPQVVDGRVRPAPCLAALPEEARAIVGWLLAKDPQARPQRAADILEVMWGAAPVPTFAPGAGGAVVAQPAGGGARSHRRRNVGVGVAAALGLSCVLVAALTVPGMLGDSGATPFQLTAITASPTVDAVTAKPYSFRPTPNPSAVLPTVVLKVTPPDVVPGNGFFEVSATPGSSCQLWRLPAAGDSAKRRSSAFTIDPYGEQQVLWGQSWLNNGTTVTVFMTCTAPNGKVTQSPDLYVYWPGPVSPSPSARPPGKS
jgi:hypothetical protein